MGEYCCYPIIGGNIPLRLKTRMMLGIRGSICDDCCMTTFCGPCTLCQIAREMKTAGWDL